jgi:hypothetical protein
MTFENPMPWSEAIDFLLRKGLLPTNLTSEELRRVGAAIREQSIFSARTVLVDYLQQIKDTVERIVNPLQTTRADRVTADNPEGRVEEGFNPASARKALREKLKELGYVPADEDRGTIKDLSSAKRINLVVDTNVKLVQGWASDRAGQTETSLLMYPALELYRQEERVKKRDWLARFRLAGAASGTPIGLGGWTITPDLRMVAIKNHPIWAILGSSEYFEDALDVSYPPFAFQSGMWVRRVKRAAAVEMGILKEGQKVEPKIEALKVNATPDKAE